MKIVALGGSIRGNRKEATPTILEIAASSKDWAELKRRMQEIAGTGLLSNTEILSAAALFGARQEGAEIDWYPLSQLFPRRSFAVYPWANEPELGIEAESTFRDTTDTDPEAELSLEATLSDADGLLLSSPVYFGDRSSVMERFMTSALARHLEGRAVGALSVGAKRNGGQETTNLYLLHQALAHGAFAVGNGPPAAQFGGTAVGGDRGAVLNDEWGLETAWATGKRVVRAAGFRGSYSPSHPFEVLVLVTMDGKDGRLAARAQDLIALATAKIPAMRASVVSLLEGETHRCLACDVCPIPKWRVSDAAYSCVIRSQEDSLASLRAALRRCDVLVLAGCNTSEKVVSHFQAFTERTRFIRRNDFELTDLPVFAFTREELGAKNNPIFDLKVLTSYLRHNALLLPSVKEFVHEGRVVLSAEDAWVKAMERAGALSLRRKKTAPALVSYKALGYRNRSLDATEAFR